MSEQVTDEVRTSVATVVQGFTAAELALRDVALAIERFRSAAEQLSEAREDQAAVRVALVETAQMADRVAVQVAAVVEALRETTDVLRGIDPDRLWSHLDKLESQQAATATVINDWIPTVDRRLVKLHEQQSAASAAIATSMATVDTELAKIQGQQTAAAVAVETRMTSLGHEARRLAWISSSALAASIVAVVVLVAIVAGLVSIR